MVTEATNTMPMPQTAGATGTTASAASTTAQPKQAASVGKLNGRRVYSAKEWLTLAAFQTVNALNTSMGVMIGVVACRPHMAIASIINGLIQGALFAKAWANKTMRNPDSHLLLNGFAHISVMQIGRLFTDPLLTATAKVLLSALGLCTYAMSTTPLAKEAFAKA